MELISARNPGKVIRLFEKWQKEYGHLVIRDRSLEDADHIYIGRGTVYGNGNVMRDYSINERLRVCVAYFYDFKQFMDGTKEGPTKEQVIALRGKKVICHCNDGSTHVDHKRFCHGFVLVAAAEMLFIRQQLLESKNEI